MTIGRWQLLIQLEKLCNQDVDDEIDQDYSQDDKRDQCFS
jgi:hypothetical protein